jgi:hypothetical protein
MDPLVKTQATPALTASCHVLLIDAGNKNITIADKDTLVDVISKSPLL